MISTVGSIMDNTRTPNVPKVSYEIVELLDEHKAGDIEWSCCIQPTIYAASPITFNAGFPLVTTMLDDHDKMNIDNRAYLMDEALSDDRTQLLIEGYMRGFEAALKAIYGEGEPHVSN